MSKKLFKQRFAEEEGGFVKFKPRSDDNSWVVSQFLVTYNTNREPTNEALEQLASFHTVLTTRKTFWKEVMKIAPVGRFYRKDDAHRHETLERTAEVPESASLKTELAKGFEVTVKAVEMEVGPERSRLHGHCLVKIKHKSRLHIDPKRFKTIANAQLERIGEERARDPISIEYVNIKWIPHHSAAVRNYVNKGNLTRVFEKMRIAEIAAQ
jgi:hypothetical protein